jgi:hypothetical protein
MSIQEMPVRRFAQEGLFVDEENDGSPVAADI